jgi:hypothetical protein
MGNEAFILGLSKGGPISHHFDRLRPFFPLGGEDCPPVAILSVHRYLNRFALPKAFTPQYLVQGVFCI